MDKKNQIPIQFYYHEVFNALVRQVAATQKEETGIPLRIHEVESLKRKFFSRMSRNDIASDECLKTLYSLALIRNSKLPIPEKKSDVKRRLIDKLTRDYLKSGFSQFTTSDLQVKNQLNIDFPNYTSFSESKLEGVHGKSDSSVHKIEELFFDSYDSTLKRNSYFQKHPLSRKATVKQIQKNVRYKAPLGTKQKLLLAGLTIATATQLLTLVPMPDIKTIETASPIETEEVSSNRKEPSSEQTALEYIYSHPSSLTKLGVPEEISDKFSQYIKYRETIDNNIQLNDSQKEEYDLLRAFIVDSIATIKIDKAISNSYYTNPSSMKIQASNGLSADVNFDIGETNHSFSVQNASDIDSNSDGAYGSDLAQALSSRDIYLSKKMNNNTDQNKNNRDDLDSAIDSILLFTMRSLNVDKDSGLITEEKNPNLLNQLGIDTIEQDVTER